MGKLGVWLGVWVGAVVAGVLCGAGAFAQTPSDLPSLVTAVQGDVTEAAITVIMAVGAIFVLLWGARFLFNSVSRRGRSA